MPVVFRENGYRFHFFSDEGDPREPVHVHVVKGNADPKFWLFPDVELAYNRGYDARTQRWIATMVALRRREIEDAWHDHFATGS